MNFNIFISCLFLFYYLLGIFFFLYKKIFNIKDFSPLLGSHGGVLDRLDSIFLISIFFILIYLFSVSVKIIIIGSTGKLGTKLLNYTSKNSIKIYITCYTNDKN